MSLGSKEPIAVEDSACRNSSIPSVVKEVLHMFELLVPLNEFNRDYLKRLLHGIPDDQLDATFGEGSHSARWILVHLAIAVDYGFKQFDLPFAAPQEWHKLYGPGSEPFSDKNVRPTKDVLTKFIHEQYAKLCQVAVDSPGKSLEVPHAVPLLDGTPLKSRADLVGHILTTHFSTHLGQLSSWRRLVGLPPLF